MFSNPASPFSPSLLLNLSAPIRVYLRLSVVKISFLRFFVVQNWVPCFTAQSQPTISSPLLPHGPAAALRSAPRPCDQRHRRSDNSSLPTPSRFSNPDRARRDTASYALWHCRQTPPDHDRWCRRR